jgi:GH24 family phage-related lysozyme (muramidase)
MDERTVVGVKAADVNFVIALMKADGFTEISKVETAPGVFTITGRRPAGVASALAAAQPATSASTISDQALSFIAEHEAYVPFCYKDSGDNATIGYGHHRGLTKDQIYRQFPAGLTEPEAWELMRKDVSDFAATVTAKITVSLRQNQFDALTMVAYGTGNIKAQTPLVNNGDHEAAADTIASIDTVGGVFNAGVAKRYQAVAAIYRHGIYPKPKVTREQHRARGIALVKKHYPNKLNQVGNKFGRPTEPEQVVQAEQAYFRMTGEMI